MTPGPTDRVPRSPRPAAFAFSPATPDDLGACETIWRTAIDDYSIPLGQHPIPPDNPSLRQLHAHTLRTDPSRFWVARRSASQRGGVRAADRADSGAPDRPIAFVSAVQRERVWFLSMLFVEPGAQAGGLGRGLLERALPTDRAGIHLATATDAAQPISNGLYARLGMVPRIPMFNLVGRPPAGVGSTDALADVSIGQVARFAADAGGAPAAPVADLANEVDALDRSVIGFAHPEDHRYLAEQGRIGFAYRTGDGRLVGYGYTSELGRIGPIAAQDPRLHAAIAVDLLDRVRPRGASAIWVPGAAADTMVALLRAGLRIEGFPVLLCWSAPFADFARYVPISPGLL